MSSSTVPDLCADEILALCEDLRLGCVDLRSGRGQRWQDGDHRRLFTELAVVFVGTDITLGAGLAAAPLPDDIARSVRLHRTPVRCFLAEDIGKPEVLAAARDDLNNVSTALPGCDVLVELHRPRPSLADAARAVELLGCGAVLDNRGLHLASGGDRDSALRFAERHGRAIQLKGYDGADPRARHVPLADCADTLDFAGRLLRAAPDAPVTVESRCADWREDISTIRRSAELVSARCSSVGRPR